METIGRHRIVPGGEPMQIKNSHIWISRGEACG
jgi:hypothetical protein